MDRAVGPVASSIATLGRSKVAHTFPPGAAAGKAEAGPCAGRALLTYRPPAAGRPVGRTACSPMKPTPEDLASLDLTRALEELAAAAYVIDREARFRWWNRAYVELFCARRGKPFADVVAPQHRELARTNFARNLVGNTTTIFDLPVVDRAGAWLTLKISSAPLRHED